MKRLLIRTISGAVYVALIVTVLYLGKWTKNEHLGHFVSQVFFLLLAMTGIYETYHNLRVKGIVTNRAWGYALGVICFVAVALAATKLGFPAIVLSFCILAMAQLARHEEHPFETICYTMLPILWVVVPLALVPMIDKWDDGFNGYIMLVFILIWVNDSFAYLTGMAFGKHKMTPRHSPNKTWEGTVGGIVCCIAAALLFGNMLTGQAVSLWKYLPLGILVGSIGTLGDLVESMFKRYVGVKDSGKLIPGHGGLLDRFDSFVMVMPFAACYLLFLFL